jgi:hypothetical protein
VFPGKALYKPSSSSHFISSFTIHSHFSPTLSSFWCSSSQAISPFFGSFFFFNFGDTMASNSDSNNDNTGRAPSVLIPHETRLKAKVIVADEHRLRHNYNILPSVRLHSQNLATQNINGGEVAIFERMLMARLRFPLSAIALELAIFLGVFPTQIVPNIWRYLFASFILWRTVTGARMIILEFFNIYRLAGKREWMVEFSVVVKPICIYLCPTYSNNKQWRQQTF